VDQWGKDAGKWFSGLFSHGKEEKKRAESEAQKALAPGEQRLAEAAYACGQLTMLVSAFSLGIPALTHRSLQGIKCSRP